MVVRVSVLRLAIYSPSAIRSRLSQGYLANISGRRLRGYSFPFKGNAFLSISFRSTTFKVGGGVSRQWCYHILPSSKSSGRALCSYRGFFRNGQLRRVIVYTTFRSNRFVLWFSRYDRRSRQYKGVVLSNFLRGDSAVRKQRRPIRSRRVVTSFFRVVGPFFSIVTSVYLVTFFFRLGSRTVYRFPIVLCRWGFRLFSSS